MRVEEIKGRPATGENLPFFLREIAIALYEINERFARQEELAEKLGKITLENAEKIAKELA